MSHKATAWAWDFDLPCIQKLVLLCVADAHNGTDGRCFPSISFIAKHCGLSLSSVKKHIAELENFLILSRTNRSLNGRRTSSEFALNFENTNLSISRDAASTKAVTRPPINREGINREESVVSQHKGAAVLPPKKRLHKIGEDKYSGLHARPAPKPAEPVNIPASLQPLVDKWAEVAVAHGPKTKALRLGVRALREIVCGKFFEDKNGYAPKARPYSVEHITKAMDVFSTMRNDPDYSPSNKTFLKRLTLADFFYSPHVRNGNGSGGGSLFLQCLKQPPTPLVESTNPELAKFVQRTAQEYMGRAVDKEGCARAANKFMRYWGEREGWLKGRGISTPKRLVVTCMQMFNERYGSKWDLGNVLGHGMVTVYEEHLGG